MKRIDFLRAARRGPLGRTGRVLALGTLFLFANVQAEISRTVAVEGRKLVFSKLTGLLYATVDSSARTYPGSVTAIDPATAKVVWSIPVGVSPWELDLSDDQRYLWVGVIGPKAVRIDLVSRRIDKEISTAFPGVQPDAFITDIEVLPGRPDSIAVSHWQYYVGGEPTGIAIFDNGVLRPEWSRQGLGVTRFTFGATPDTIWGYNGDTTGFETYRFEVDERGIRAVEDPIFGLFSDFFLDPIFHEGLLYSREGRVVDPAKRRPVGRFYLPYRYRNGGVALDAVNRRIYFANTTLDHFQLIEFDLESYRPTRALETTMDQAKVPAFFDSMADCGPAGFALGGFDLDIPSITIIPRSALRPVSHYERPPAQPASAGIRRIRVPNNSIVYSPSRDRIYASLSNGEYDIGNSVVPIDPTAGVVEEPVWVGSNPGPMTVSEDGRFLFVALQDNHSVRRLRLPELQPDVEIPLFSEPRDVWWPSYPARANELLALPGQPGSVAIVKAAVPGSSYPTPYSVVVYDGGIERTKKVLHLPDDRQSRILSLQPSPDASAFYGFGAGAVSKLSLDDSGLRVESHRREVASSVYAELLRCQYGYCFTPYGAVIDGERQERLAEFYFDLFDPVFDWPAAVLPDLDRGLVYFAHSHGGDSYVSAYDVRTLRIAARLKLPGVEEVNGGMLFWGRDQIAVGARGEIVLFPISAIHSMPVLAQLPDMRGERLYVPFFRAGPFNFTGVAVSNPGGGEAHLQWEMIGSGGETAYFGGPVEMALPPDTQTARLATEIFGVGPGSQVEGVWIQMKADSGRLGSFFQYGTSEGLDGAVALREPAREFHFTRMFQGPRSLRGHSAKTFFAIANPNGFAVDLLITAFAKGRRSVDPPITTVRPYRLGAKGSLYDTLFWFGQEYSDAYVKVETLEKDAGVVGFALVEVEEGRTLIGVPMQTEIEGDRLHSAQMAFGPAIFTSLKLINVAAQNRNLTLRAIADNGSELAPPVALRLRPGEALERDVVEIFNFFGLTSAAGSLLVESDGPGVIGDVLFGDPADLRYAASLPLQKRPFRKAVFSQVANRHDFFTGLAFFNPSPAEASIRIEVFAENGTRTGESTVPLGPGRRLSRLLSELIPSTAGQERGFVVVESDVPVIGQQLFGDYRLTRLSAVPPTVIE